MTAEENADDTATAAFKALQAKARADHRGDTHSRLVLYAVESFLRRLAASRHAERLVLKGGMLMAASDIRAVTRDADLSAAAMASDEETVRRVVAEICATEVEPPDGIAIDTATIRAPQRERANEDAARKLIYQPCKTPSRNGREPGTGRSRCWRSRSTSETASPTPQTDCHRLTRTESLLHLTIKSAYTVFRTPPDARQTTSERIRSAGTTRVSSR